MEFQNGKAEFRLHHEQYVSVTGLPAGCAYRVEEADYWEQGYITTATGEEGVIAKNETKVAIFENVKNNKVPQTGDGMPLALLGLMMVFAAAGALLCARKRAR